MRFFNYLRSVFGAKEPPAFSSPDARVVVEIPVKPEPMPVEESIKQKQVITETQLKEFSPSTPDSFIPAVCLYFNKYATKYGVDTPLRIAAFFSQVIHESNAFKALREYASGAAYEGRKDLGNIYKGDGVKFKGRGYIQITGRNNYAALSKFMFGDNRLLDNPELLATPQYAMLSAFWYWGIKELNKYSDYPVTQIISTKQFGKVYPFEWITILINGGRNGLQDRVSNYNRIAKVLNIPKCPIR